MSKNTNSKLAWHVTPTANLASILNLGLLPHLPESSGDLAVSFFRTEADAQRETLAWLASKWAGRPLSILTVDITGLRLTETFPYELITASLGPVSSTRVLSHRPFDPVAELSTLNTPAPTTATVLFEAFKGLSFWDRHGDGGDVLGARARSVSPDSLVDRFPLYAPEFLEFQVTFALTRDTKIVALAGCSMPDPRHPKSLGLSYVTVDTDDRGRGYGSMLCKSIAEYMVTQGLRTLDCSGYSPLGHERLRPVLLRETKTAGIRMKDVDAVEYSNQGTEPRRRMRP